MVCKQRAASVRSGTAAPGAALAVAREKGGIPQREEGGQDECLHGRSEGAIPALEDRGRSRRVSHR